MCFDQSRGCMKAGAVQGGSVARYTVLEGEDPVEALLSLIRLDNNLGPDVEFGQYQGGFMDRWAQPRQTRSRGVIMI